MVHCPTLGTAPSNASVQCSLPHNSSQAPGAQTPPEKTHAPAAAAAQPPARPAVLAPTDRRSNAKHKWVSSSQPISSSQQSSSRACMQASKRFHSRTEANPPAAARVHQGEGQHGEQGNRRCKAYCASYTVTIRDVAACQRATQRMPQRIENTGGGVNSLTYLSTRNKEHPISQGGRGGAQQGLLSAAASEQLACSSSAQTLP